MAGPSALLHDNWELSFQHLRVANVSLRNAEEENPCEELNNGETVCKNCKTVIFCIDKKGYEAPCSEGQTCQGKEPEAKCEASSGGAQQTRADDNCKCEAGDQGFVADPFDPSSYLLCPSGELKSCSEGKVFNPKEEKCEEAGESGGGSQQECTEMGVFPVLPDCKAYYTCFETDNGLESTKETACDDGKIFDDKTKDCQDAPEDPGETKCTGFGMVKDNHECNRYLLCVGADIPPSTALCCEDGKVFDSDAKGCVEPAATSASVQCLGECALASLGVTPACAPSAASSTASSRDASASTPSSSSSPSSDSSAASTAASSEATTGASSEATTAASSSASSSAASPASSSAASPASSSAASTAPSASTSPETPTCTKTGTIPYPGDCTKYYVCKGLPNGGFEMKDYKCPGELLFSPSKLYCTVAAKVPECAQRTIRAH
ncbi:uncharacterized protein LOC143030643 [Oratosquilla oratoria]|uniref:uncharacterized protein LOC143030642 n=1 Tax=Oratosquilla oratoria TaxID=337810 RepID=UPI003F76F1D3